MRIQQTYQTHFIKHYQRIKKTATKAVADAEKTDFYQNQSPSDYSDIQNSTKKKTYYIALQDKTRESDIKGLGTKGITALKEPRYPQNNIYIAVYV